MDRSLTLDPANLRPYIACAPLVLDDEVNTLHHQPVLVMVPLLTHVMPIDPVSRDHAVDGPLEPLPFTPGSSGISAGDDFYQIALFYPFHSALLTTRSQHFGCQRNDLHKTSFAQFPSHWSKNTSPLGILLLIQDNSGIIIELDMGPIGTAYFFRRAHDDGPHHITLFHRSPRRSPFDRSHDLVADTTVSARRTTQDADAQNFFTTGIVRHF
jgi:hypothetical protein